MTKKVAFVVQRCGLEVNGGAELLCRLVAEHMAERMPTEVLTTCAVDYLTWANHYQAGEEWLQKLCIRRFPVARPRDLDVFSRLTSSIQPRLGRLRISEEEEWMREQGPWSPDLFQYVEERKNDYDAFFFFTYLYASTYFALPSVAEKAILVPLAHDEWPIYLTLFDRLMRMPRAFAFQTPEELDFLRRRFPGVRLEGPMLGAAVDPPARTDPESFRRAHHLERPFLLYAGRVDVNKGIPELIQSFDAYQRSMGDDALELVLVGRCSMDLPPVRGVRSLGFLPEQAKWDAIAACEAFVMPSPYESLSIACLEAWSQSKPVLVNARSEVLVGQCRRSQGGLWYRDVDEFCAALELLIAEPALRTSLGAQGRQFVEANYRWPRIIDGYSALVSACAA